MLMHHDIEHVCRPGRMKAERHVYTCLAAAAYIDAYPDSACHVPLLQVNEHLFPPHKVCQHITYCILQL